MRLHLVSQVDRVVVVLVLAKQCHPGKGVP